MPDVGRRKKKDAIPDLRRNSPGVFYVIPLIPSQKR